MNIDALYEIVKSRYPINFVLRKEQEDVISHLLQREDVIAILPTGYGKTMTYTLTPLLLDEVS
jgi:superfamily II DNA helicase RecQ